MPKHLIFLIDGTWLAAQKVGANSFHSNIHKINLELQSTDCKGNPQIIFYTRGIGSTTSINKYTAGGFAKGIDDIISDIYITLCSNFENGDKIYIFGFSRGAVVARAIVGMIARFGLLNADSINLYDLVWSSFVGVTSQSAINAIKTNSKKHVIVEFLGLFDCVFGGTSRSQRRFHRLRFQDLNVENCVRHLVHLQAIDEQRLSFTNLPIEKVLNFRPQAFETKIEQIWIPGVHSDVGGAYERRFLGDVALITMIDRVLSSTKLAFYDQRLLDRYSSMIDLFVNGHIHINNEMRGLWSVLGTRQRVLSTRTEGQFLHPIVNLLKRRLVYYKNCDYTTEYALPSTFQELPLFRDFHIFKFKKKEFFYIGS